MGNSTALRIWLLAGTTHKAADSGHIKSALRLGVPLRSHFSACTSLGTGPWMMKMLDLLGIAVAFTSYVGKRASASNSCVQLLAARN